MAITLYIQRTPVSGGGGIYDPSTPSPGSGSPGLRDEARDLVPTDAGDRPVVAAGFEVGEELPCGFEVGLYGAGREVAGAQVAFPGAHQMPGLAEGPASLSIAGLLY